MPDQAYTNRYGSINTGEAPPPPAYRRSVQQRRALSMEQCRTAGKHAGRARRHRREKHSRDTLDFLAALASGEQHRPTRGGGRFTLRELLDGGRQDRPQWVRRMQNQARHLYQLAEGHGPGSGWGIAQPTSWAKGNPKWTPYWVPKAAEKCWRWWRRVALTLRHLLDTLARALLETVPLHRNRLEQVTAEKDQRGRTETASPETTGCRDRFGDEPGPVPPELARAIERARGKQAQAGLPGLGEASA